MQTSQWQWRELSLWGKTHARRALGWLEGTLLQVPHDLPAATAVTEGYAAILAGASLGSLFNSATLLQRLASQALVSPGEFHALDEHARVRGRSFLRNSCLLLAASRLGRMDVLTEPAVTRLQAYQHQSGGFFDMDPAQGHGMMEAFTIAWGGRVALRLAWHERARRAARLLSDMLHIQPDPEGRLYFCYDTGTHAVATRWRPSDPTARFVEFNRTAGETHQVGMVLSFLCEMHLADPAGAWNQPAIQSLHLIERWCPTLLRLSAMGTVAEGLALAVQSLGRAGEPASDLLRTQVDGLSAAVEASGSLPPWDAGVGPDYERAYTAVESTGWAAVCLAGLAQACATIGS